jgi:PAS domain S-box-containing protein
VPFIFVSGTIGEDAAIEAMLGGAADYVLKTKMSRFYPAIGRVLRESAERENRKLVEKELHKFKLAIEQTEDIIVITDKDGFIEYVNPAYEKVTGYRADEVIGKTPRIIKSGHHDKSVYDSLWKTLRTGRTFHVEFINKKKSGDLFYEQQTISPILD